MNSSIKQERGREHFPALFVLNPHMCGCAWILFRGADERRFAAGCLSVNRSAFLFRGSAADIEVR